MTRPWRAAPPSPRLSVLDGVLRTVAPALSAVHPSLTEGVFGPRPQNARGVSLDPVIHLLVGIEGSTTGPKETPAQMRHNMRRGIRLIERGRQPIHSLVETVVAGDLPVRVYRPSGARDLPWMMFLHGGGWATGDLDSHDRICRRLAVEGELVVAAVDYRLAPEHPFPAAVDDVERAWTALSKVISRFGGVPHRGSVGGDSAGGNLSAVLCQRIRDGHCDGPPPVMQLLIYPVIDFRQLDASQREFAEGFLLTADGIDTYKALYAAPDTDPRASPILHPDLSGLPPAVVVTAGFDPLRDEAERYVHALRAAGSPAGWLEGPGLVHGFVQMMQVVPAADALVQRFVAVTREVARTGVVPVSLARAEPPCGSL